MSLFRRVHIRTVPSEFLDPGSQPIQLRFCQLNAKKMAKADLADTLAAIEQLNQIMASMSDKDRAVALDRQKHAAPKAQDTAAPNTFADYDNTTLIALAHVERRADDGSEWIELTTTEIDDLLCAEWLAGEIYDVSKPKSDEAREKKLIGFAAHLHNGAPARGVFSTKLQELVKPDLDYPRKHFRFALLEYRAASTPEDVILKRETFWKEALLTRGKYGLNSN